MKALDWLVLFGAAMLIAGLYAIAIGLDRRNAHQCVARGGHYVYTTCLRKDTVLP